MRDRSRSSLANSRGLFFVIGTVLFTLDVGPLLAAVAGGQEQTVQVAASQQARTPEGDHVSLGAPPAEYKSICVGEVGGTLFVWGTLTDRFGKGKDGALVQLSRPSADRPKTTTYTGNGGKYCLTFKPGPTVSELSFAPSNGTTCVTNISGNDSHVINKVIEQDCSTRTNNGSTRADRKTVASLVTPRFAAEAAYTVYLTDLSTARALWVNDVHWEPEDADSPSSTTCKSLQWPNKPVPAIDADMVAAASVGRITRVSLLKLGAIDIFGLSLGHEDPNAAAAILRRGLRLNEVLPANYSQTRLVFFPRSAFPKGTDGTSGQPCGEVVVRGTEVGTVN